MNKILIVLLSACLTASAQTVTNYAPGTVTPGSTVTTTNKAGVVTSVITPPVTNPPVAISVTTTVAPVTVPLAGLSTGNTSTNDQPPASVTPSSVIGLLQGYLMVNDASYNGWQSNHFDIFQAAVFQNVAGTPGASAVGDVLGVEVPIWRTASLNEGFHVESLTDFETVFGDVGWQGIGLGFDYNIHQVQVSAEIDGDLGLHGPFTGTVAPGIEFKKASTSLGGTSPIFRWEIPIRHQTGFGRIFFGVQVPL